jgi:ribosome biogenesis GTPase / thiamine phosphate phosphatase
MPAPPPPSRPLGWDEEWERAWQRASDGPLRPCRVVRIDKGGITVSLRSGEEQLVVAAKSARRVVVGDVCALDAGAGRIERILPRRTVFERRSPGASRDQLQLRSRPLAANMDRVFVLQPFEPGVNLSRLSRELVLAWESGAQPVVVLTKSDLASAQEVESQVADARRFSPGVDLHVVSSQDRSGLEELRRAHVAGHLIVLLGASGAGKSSLVNALAGREVQLVAEVRETDLRGRHTTTAGQIVELPEGALLIDTPGIRGVGLWSCDDGLERAFDDLGPFAQACRFDDCTHTTEPGCGLLDAVDRGDLGADRLEVWQSLAAELDDLAEGLEERERVEQRLTNQRARRRARRRDEDG